MPEYDDRALYEKLVLDGFQAGLSWITILRKRDNFRRAFDGFEPEKIARYDARKSRALMKDAGIVRNRAEDRGRGALRARLARGDGEGAGLLAASCGTSSTASRRCNKFREHQAGAGRDRAVAADVEGACRRAASSSCGPTIVYAFMQAVGMVNDHLVTCHRHAAVRKLGGTDESSCASRAEAPQAARRSPPRLAAHAVGTAARSARPLAARRRDRRHRAWARTRRALERADRRARTSFRSRSTRCWSRRIARATRAVSTAGRLAVLLHDAPEYVIGDMISPFKAVIGDAYKTVETRLLAAIHLRFGLPAKLPDPLQTLIKSAD